MNPTSRVGLQLFALPLSRRSAAQTPLFYLHAKRLPQNTTLLNADGTKRAVPWSTRGTNWAANNWAKLGAAKEGSWKRWAYTTGDKLMDKIEFEEWSLKAIDPALSPKPWAAIAKGLEGIQEEKERREGKVTLYYPPSLLSPEPLLETLQAQIAHREPHHKTAMYKWLAGAPFALLFGLVPLIPNFPLFYILWRAYSHFRGTLQLLKLSGFHCIPTLTLFLALHFNPAWKASEYLKLLLSHHQITFLPSPHLDKVYSPTETSELLLTMEKVPKLVQAFQLSEEEGQELKRAVMQARIRLDQALKEELEAGGKKVE